MSEALMNPAVYYHQFTAEEAIAAELRDIAHRLDYVMAHASGKFDTCELHEQSEAMKQLAELITALSTNA